MSDAEIVQGEQAEETVERTPAALIESRFLFVDVAALRAKQLRRGARSRLPLVTEDAPAPRSQKAERAAMEEVRERLVDWDLPEFKVVVDNR